MPIFDGHNDVLLAFYERDHDVMYVFDRSSKGHIDLPRAREGGTAGGFFAVYLPADPSATKPDELAAADLDPDLHAAARAAWPWLLAAHRHGDGRHSVPHRGAIAGRGQGRAHRRRAGRAACAMA